MLDQWYIVETTIYAVGLVAFLLGREVQPRVGPLNIKIFCIIHLAVLGWAAILSVTAFQAYETGNWNAAFVAVVVFQSVYILDIILFEVSISKKSYLKKESSLTSLVYVFKSTVLLWCK